jgi:hypothetical protein
MLLLVILTSKCLQWAAFTVSGSRGLLFDSGGIGCCATKPTL